MTSYPYWLSPADLGIVPNQTSFSVAPTTLLFGESLNLSCTVSLLNGSLPPALTWRQQGYSVVITGVVDVGNTSSDYEFTFRASNGTFVADRTFKLSVSAVTSSFVWDTDNAATLIYAYTGDDHTGTISATSVPSSSVTYAITNTASITQGVSINPSSGEITVNIGWLPNTEYLSSRDRVYNNNQLYTCVVSGNSASSGGPVGVGSEIVDSDWLAWQPLRLYLINSVVTNNVGRIYVCVQQGVSAASGGPTGTGSNISDNTVRWNYVDQAPVWSSVAAGADVAVNLNCSASIVGSTINRVFSLILLSRPHAPVWITPAGRLGNPDPLQLWSLELVAFDPDGLALVWTAVGLPAWLNLSNVGLLWGTTPATDTNLLFSFAVSVSDGVTTVSRSFEVQVTRSVQLFYWTTAADLGSVQDGRPSTAVVNAISLRPGAAVSYGLSGGCLPPLLTVNNSSGALQGFVEYHAQPRSYEFEITAMDGSQTIVRQFSLGVISNNLGHFTSIRVPLLGPHRYAFINNNNDSVVDDQNIFLPSDDGWGRVQRPGVVLISGMRAINPVDLRQSISNWLHSFDLVLADARTVTASDQQFNQVYLAVRDSNSLAVWQPLTAYAKGTVISNADGVKYVAVTAGTSASTQPRGYSTSIADGSVIWRWESTPNTAVDRSYALPWYAHHYYPVGSTVVNSGQAYATTTAGFSDGDQGPQGTGSIMDGTVVWQSVNYSQSSPAPNEFWPSSVYNIRKKLIDTVGWSTTWGSGALAVPVIDATTGGIQSVTVLAAGTGYYVAPVINTVGPGSGAQLVAQVGIVAATVNSSSQGFVVSQTLGVDLGSGTAAVLAVASVDSFGRVQTLSVQQPGSFERVPSNAITVDTANGDISFTVTAGIVSIDVIQTGEGYRSNSTVLNLQGREWDPSLGELVNQFVLKCAMVYTLPSTGGDVVSSNPFVAQTVEASVVEVTTQGVQWQGLTRFDGHTCTFDSASTAWVESTPANQTVFDQNLTVWENSSTSWDLQPLSVWPQPGLTVFDQNQTIFDYYRTLFDQPQPSYSSATARSQIWHMGKPSNV